MKNDYYALYEINLNYILKYFNLMYTSKQLAIGSKFCVGPQMITENVYGNT